MTVKGAKAELDSEKREIQKRKAKCMEEDSKGANCTMADVVRAIDALREKVNELIEFIAENEPSDEQSDEEDPYSM